MTMAIIPYIGDANYANPEHANARLETYNNPSTTASSGEEGGESDAIISAFYDSTLIRLVATEDIAKGTEVGRCFCSMFMCVFRRVLVVFSG